jgi:hypothetical protein
MKTSQSFGIHFTIRGYQAKEGKAPLYAVVTVNKERVLIGLKQKVNVKNWDSGKGAPRGNREDVKQMNAYLGEVRLALGNCYKELQLKGRLPSASAVKSLYLGEAEEKLCQKYFIAANPQFKTVDLFDHQMKKIKREELLNTDPKPVRNLKQRKQQKEDAPAKKHSRKAKVHV